MQIVVGIDPGHGMSNREHARYDPGAVHEDIHEAKIALAVGMLLRDQCRQRGWTAHMTRLSNVEPMPLRDRVARLRSLQCDAIVSIHCNAWHTPFANGTETLYLTSEWVASAVQRRLIGALGTKNRGAKQRDDLSILRYERISILCELGFLSNKDDREVITDPAKQLAAAMAIAEGLNETVRL